MRSSVGLAAILAVAVALRAHDLGADALWYDEVAQFQAATPPTLGAMLEAVRRHAHAMPLDYAVTRWVAGFGSDEATLRLPALAWGSLAVAFWALVARRVLGPAAGLLAAWMLALSAIHVEYSQELRFYAALFAWHGASTWLVLDALERGGARRWAAWVAVTWMGAHFHVFVVLTAAGGAGLALAGLPRRAAAPGGGRGARGPAASLALSTLALAAAFAPTYRRFTAGEAWDFDVLGYHDSLGQVLAQGLGWSFALPGERAAGWGAWGVISSALAAIGALDLGRRRAAAPGLAGLVLGAALQGAVILAGVWTKGFFFLPRQVMHLAPVVMMLSAHGAVALARLLAARGAPGRRAPQAVLPSVGLLLALAAAPRLGAWFGAEKSDARALVAGLLDGHADAPVVYVIPAREADVYRHYLQREGDPGALADRLRDMRWESLDALPTPGPGPPAGAADASGSAARGPALIAPVDEVAGHAALLERHGFRVVWSPEGRRGRIRALLRRG